ncbi:MAG TPA: cell envelope integrity protein CreD [Rhizomicrobium sp.]
MANDGVLSAASRVFRSPGLKFVLIAVLTVLMAVPLFFIQLALADREERAAGAVQDVAAGWGGPQVVAGPVLLVPYTVQTETTTPLGAATQTVERHVAVVLPENLGIKAYASEQTRWRGIFSVPVYRAALDLHATFDKAALARIAAISGAVLHWNEATISVLVTDPHGLADSVAMTANGRTIAFQPGSGMEEDGPAGIQAPLNLTAPADLTIDTHFALRGARELSFAPLGRRTTASVQSTWASPSFFGAFLPTERKLGKDGFTASWVVPYLARGFGQSFPTAEKAGGVLLSAASGVKFYQPVDHYQLVERSLKYAIMFIALAFLIFFVMETVSPRRLHAIQYALVGAAQVLFYLLLLSFCEHIGFLPAYLVASAATIALTSAYALSALASKARAAVLCVNLTGLYVLLYVILNAEDYALLIGSSLLFAALAATMYVTRRIDWYRRAEVQTA